MLCLLWLRWSTLWSCRMPNIRESSDWCQTAPWLQSRPWPAALLKRRIPWPSENQIQRSCWGHWSWRRATRKQKAKKTINHHRKLYLQIKYENLPPVVASDLKSSTDWWIPPVRPESSGWTWCRWRMRWPCLSDPWWAARRCRPRSRGRRPAWSGSRTPWWRRRRGRTRQGGAAWASSCETLKLDGAFFSSRSVGIPQTAINVWQWNRLKVLVRVFYVPY